MWITDSRENSFFFDNKFFPASSIEKKNLTQKLQTIKKVCQTQQTVFFWFVVVVCIFLAIVWNVFDYSLVLLDLNVNKKCNLLKNIIEKKRDIDAVLKLFSHLKNIQLIGSEK